METMPIYTETAYRISQIRKLLCNGSNTEFAAKIGKSTQYASQLCSGSRGIGKKILGELLDAFPQVNRTWLLLGEGDMLKGVAPIAATAQANDDTPSLPLVPFEAIAGLPTIDNIGVAFADCEQYKIPDFALLGADFMVRASGMSMYPIYFNGDLLACRIIKDVLFFQWGKVYVLDTSQGMLVKRVEPSNDPDCITLVSENAERYKPFDIPKSDIRFMAAVLGFVRLE